MMCACPEFETYGVTSRLCRFLLEIGISYKNGSVDSFNADRTNGRAYGTLLRLSLSAVCRLYGMYCG